jgi:acetyl-CoA synthetase
MNVSQTMRLWESRIIFDCWGDTAVLRYRPAVRKNLVQWVGKEIGSIASLDLIQFAPGMPKMRSGKIMRRILRKIAEDEYGRLGDTSTLADPAVVDDLVSNRQNRKSA